MAEKRKGSDKGQRMKRAAEAAGFKSNHVAEALGVSAATVRHWYAGRTEPGMDDLAGFATLTGISVDYIIYGNERGRGPVMNLREWMLRVADLVNAGADPTAAALRVTRVPGMSEAEAIALLGFTDAEKAFLNQSAEAMRQQLQDRAGGSWDEVSEDRKLEILQELHQEALRNEEFRASREAESQ